MQRRLWNVQSAAGAWLLASSLSAAAYGLPSLTTSTQFLPANLSRTSMDIGGAWNGTADVTATTGDGFRFSIANGVLATPAYDLVVTATLPTGFQYVSGTAAVSLTGSGCGAAPSATASQVGTALTFTISPAGYDLPGDCAATFAYGLVTSNSVTAGTYAIQPAWNYANTDGGALVGAQNTTQNVLVQGGAVVLTLTPASQTKAVGQTANFTASACNTGVGGLFGVTLDESAINPNPANSLQILSMTQSLPAAPTATGTMPVLTLPYLAPGVCFTAAVTADVTGCASITNAAESTDRTGTIHQSVLASVTLDLTTPLITYSPSSVTVPYTGSTTVSFPVQNTGLGTAYSTVLQTNLESLPLNVTNVAAGWTYNSVNGNFTRTGGTVAIGPAITLSFDVAQTSCPPVDANYRIIWQSSYLDGCTNPYAVPSTIQSVDVGGTFPLRMEKTGPSRVNLNETGTWNLTLTPQDISQLTTTNVVVTDTLPSSAVAINVGTAPPGTSYSCGGPCGPGSTINWTVPKAVLTAPVTLPISFTAPSNPCVAGGTLFNTATATSAWGPSPACTFNTNASATTYLAQTPGFSSTQSYNLAAGVSGSISFETGAIDNGNQTRDVALGEGEFLSFSNTYDFSVGHPGTWSGSTYRDDFAGLSGQTVVPGTLLVRMDSTTTVPVPGGYVSATSGQLLIDLSFLSGPMYLNDPNVGSHRIDLEYKTTVPDANLPLPAEYRDVVGTSMMKLAGGASGCVAGSDITYTQPLQYRIYRAISNVALSFPPTLDVCQTFSVTATTSGRAYGGPWNALLTQSTSGSYEYPTGQTPSYGGAFSGNVTYAENGGTNPSFTFGPLPLQQASNGSATYQMRVKAGSSTTPAPISASVQYDDTYSQAGSLPRDFTSNTSPAPFLIKAGDLEVVTSPSTLYVTGSKARFRIYVVNGGDGTAYGAQVEDTLPSGLTPNSADTNAANPGYPVIALGQTMTWSLGDIAPGATRIIDVVADAAGSTCSIPDGSNQIQAKWGCGGTWHETATSSLPNFRFPSGQFQVIHDTSNTQVGVCDATGGRATIVARNTGLTHLYDVRVREVTEPMTNGIDLAGSAEYSINGGMTWTPVFGAPSGSGTTASPYIWDSTNIPELADVGPQSEGGFYEVRVRVALSGNESTNGALLPMNASGSATVACGTSVNSPGVAITPTVRRPNITVSTAGRVGASGPYSDTVYGKPGDAIEWRVSVQNSGALPAENGLFSFDIPNSPAGPTALLNGPGATNVALTDGVAHTYANVSASSTSTYVVSQTLGATCVNQSGIASVTWGCDAVAPHLSTPTDNSDGANLVMSPDFTGSGLTQSFTSLNGGRGEIAITINNSGAYSQNLVLTNTLPSGVAIDTTFTPTVSSSGAVTAVALGGTSAIPVFTLTGTLDHATNAVVTFRVQPSTGFDTTSDYFTIPETAGGFDPSPPGTGNNVVRLDFEDGCGSATFATHSLSIDPLTPDLDFTLLTPATRIVADATAYDFDFRITNNGDPGSVADHFFVTPSIGAGFTAVTVTVTTPGSGGTGGACAGTCTAAQMGTLAAGANAVIRVHATANANGSPLTVRALVTGEAFHNDGTSAGTNYSLDGAQVRIAGYAQSLTLVSTNETFTADPNVAIGEESTWRLRTEWFGADPSDPTSGFSAITVRNTLPANLGYVSHANTVSSTVGYSVTGNTAGASGAINFAVNDITPAAASGIFEVDLVARTLNVAGNTQGATITNNLGNRFTLFGTVLASNAAADNFSGGTQTALHSAGTLTVARPVLTFAKQVRNIDTGSALAASGAGEGGDVLEYVITVGNTGTAPAFDLSVVDTMPSKLIVVAGAADGVDNDTDGSVDGGDLEGTFVPGAGGSVTFNDTNTALTLGSSLGRLNSGSTVTLRYRASLNGTVIPAETVPNAAAITATTLSGPTGNQTGTTGATGTASGELQLSANSAAGTTITSVGFGKTLQTTSVNADASTTVLVGEQARYRISLVLPEGTTPALVVNDSIPQGLVLVARTAPAFGASISGCTTPAILPASLPATANPLAMQWNFGTCTVAAGTTAQRTLTIDYDVQVRNIAGNSNGTTLASSATYSFTGFTSAASTITLTNRVPNVTGLSVTVLPTTNVDAGDVLTYTVTAQNTGTVTAYNLNLADALPAGTSYIAGTTNVTAGPAITEPDVTGQNLVWGRGQTVPQTINLAAAATLTFTYQARLTDAVEPSQALTNAFVLDYTSLPGSPGPDLGSAVLVAGGTSGERIGTGTAPNTLRATSNATSTVKNSTTVAKVKSGDFPSISGFRVGDIVTYTVQATVQEGTIEQFRIEDVLPVGLALIDFDPIAPAPGGSGFFYVMPTAGVGGPSAGATGTLTWTLGTISTVGDNSAANQTLTLVYRARVVDASGVATTPTTQTLSNSALARYVNSADVAQASTASVAAASVKQPVLSTGIALRVGQSTSVTASDSVRYRVTVSNLGAGPAYNGVVVATLPVGLRAATPTAGTITLNGAPTTLSPPSYSSLTGVLTWTLADGEVLNPAQDLVIDFDATADTDVGGGLSLSTSALTNQYFSLASAGTPTDRRQYAATSSANVAVTTPQPANMGKVVDVAQANVGQTVTYTLRVPQTAVNVALYDVDVSDALPAGLRRTGTSVTGALGVVNTSTATTVALRLGQIVANGQAVITVTAVIEDVAGNSSATVRNNTAAYTWAPSIGGTTQTAITSPTATYTIREPVLTIDQTFVSESLASAPQGLQTGDTIRYRYTITNTGTGPAHDLQIHDAKNSLLLTPSVIANPDAPGAPTSNTVGSTTTWTWSVSGPLAAGATYVFDAVFTVGAVQPYQALTSQADAAWNSTAGVNADERAGTATDATSVTRTTGPVTFTKVESAPAPGAYAIGETVTYRLRIDFIAGQLKLVHFVDTLPSGLTFVSATPGTVNARRLGGGAVTIVSGPAAGAGSPLDFELGDIESTGTNPALFLDVVARVRDTVTNALGTTLTNVAEVRFDNPNTPGTPVTVPATTSPVITVLEPQLQLALDSPATVSLGNTSTLTARIRNAGTSTGYRPVVVVQMPVGMRNYDPSANAITAVAGVRALTKGTDFTAVYVPASGVLTLTFTTASTFVATSEVMTIGIPISLDNNLPAGTNLAPEATITSFLSRPAAGTDVRSTVPLGTETLGTTGGGTPDDAKDDAPFTTLAPTLTVRKTVDKTTANPGETLHYTIVVTNAGGSDATITSFADTLPTDLLPGSIANLSLQVTGATSVAGVGISGGGVVTVTNTVIAHTGGTMTIQFDATLKAVLPNGRIVGNSASMIAAGYGSPFVSDSTAAADDDAIELGNAPSDDQDDDSTKTTITSAPVLGNQKISADLNGAPLATGDTLLYTITLTNTGNENTHTASVQDLIPSNTTYVPNSTTLNGAPVTDVAGTSPLVAGLTINGPSDAIGTLLVNSTVVVTFRVTVDALVASGTAVSNQATLTAQRDGSGSLPAVPSDDPRTSLAGDPTVDVVGNGPNLRAQKTVTDLNGAPLTTTEILEYRISLRNSGTGPATQVVVSDPMPTGTTFVPGSLLFDADGPSAPAPLAAMSDALDSDAVDFGGTTANRVTARIASLAAGAEVTIRFQVTVDGTVTNGTVLRNQASIASAELPLTYSDADGNISNGAQSTDIAVGTGAAIRLTKSVQDANGGQLRAGDELLYTMVLSNIGSAPAAAMRIVDPAPPLPTTYNVGSTTWNGAPVTDNSAASALVSPGILVGTLNPGDTHSFQFRVTIPLGTPATTQISNQASYSGALSGISDSDLNDGIETGNDALDSNDDDPTVVQLGGTVGLATVRGKVWLDTDRSGTFTLGEAGQSGWIVEILQGGSVLATAATAADGTWEVRDLSSGGGYQIRFRHPLTRVVYGNVKSSAPGATTNTGVIDNLTLPSGITVLDQNLPLDPSGLFYNSVTRIAVEGVTARITGPPGFDASTMTLPGQAVQTSAADGRYRFDLLPAAPAGVYRIIATVPGGFLPIPSTIIPPQPGPLLSFGMPSPFAVVPSNNAPTGADPTTYYLDFHLTPGNPGQPDVVNNHIAIDPVLGGAISILKTTPFANVRRGELVPYTIIAKNRLQATLANIDIIDTLPPGFKYVEGSGRLANSNLEPTRAGRTLTWTDQTFLAGETKIFKLVTIAGAGVSEGRYVNDAVAFNNIARAEVSNHGTATVLIIPDETFDCPEVIGKVFDDRNRNGAQDENEPGLPGVRIATARGWLVTTDEYGRFHVTCPLIPRATTGSNFVMKVDERTLPTGYRVTTENPHVVKLTMGKMTKLNFGASIHRVVRLEVTDSAFVANSSQLADAYKPKLVPIATLLAEGRSVLRIAYRASITDKRLVRARLDAIRKDLGEHWKQLGQKDALPVEEELSWAKGGSHE